ncbi:MAG TPA: Isoquinoline 1-oxidoreductase subunit [Methylomirabilota bacterium]|jgi:hypothetical protein|nr:Isoquinoline 1-oxidoreductase subunit [Methylomirabilota bacterium]
MAIRWRAVSVLAGGAALALAAFSLAGLARDAGAQGPRQLRPPSAFVGIGDPAQRSAALFVEASKVLQHPRCVNCHPAGDRPLQGEDGRPHQPGVHRGSDGHGVAGLHCTACHQAANYDAVGMPGHPKWHLAPASMAWQGRSLAEVCGQIKDPTRNGGHSLAEIVEHMTHDSLVGWAWSPGVGREPVPGTQAEFGALIKAWVDTGAVCPGR